MKNIFSFILAMCWIIKAGVGGFSHLAFNKVKVVLNSLKKTSGPGLQDRPWGRGWEVEQKLEEPLNS